MIDFSQPAAEARKSEKLPDDGRNAIPDLTRLESILREVIPGTPYEVTARQPTDYTEYTYHEAFGCFIVATQSPEINARIVHAASKYDFPPSHITPPDVAADIAKIDDKWQHDGELQSDLPKRVIFWPGGNLNWIVNMDNAKRAVFDEEWKIKPHPVTAPDYLAELRRTFTIRNLLPHSISGMHILRNATHVGYTTTSELGIVAMCNGIKTRDFTLYDLEHHGSMFPFYRAIRHARNYCLPGNFGDYELYDPCTTINRIAYCPWSGVIPLTYAENHARMRMEKFHDRALSLRSKVKPLIRNAHQGPALRRASGN